MYYVLFTALMSTLVPLALIITTLSVSRHSSKDRENISPFECGFDPLSSARLPFSMRFFLLAVIFLVFDIEIVLLMPLILISPSTHTIVAATLFLLILLLGLFHEWNEGSLNWN